MPKPEAAHVPETPPAPVAPPPAPVLLDAAIVEQRVTAERAAAFAEGKAARQPEIDALATERDTLKTTLAQSQANVTQLTATVAAEKSARIAAETAHAKMMGGVKFTPETEKTWPELFAKHGYAARQMFPEVWRAHMKATVPGWKEHKQENSHG
jgi:hypothetical protein